MARFKYYTRSIKGDKENFAVYLRYTVGRGKADYHASMGITVYRGVNYKDKTDSKAQALDTWNESEKRLKARNTVKDARTHNIKLDEVERHFKNFTTANDAHGIIPSYADIKEHHKTFFKEPEPVKEDVTDLLKYFPLFIARAEKEINPHTRKRVGKGTIKTYKRTFEFLKGYKKSIPFNKLDSKWYNEFVDYCEGLILSANYIGAHVKTIKAVMNRAVEDGLTDNLKHQKFMVLKEDAYNIALTIDELKRMYELDLSHNERMQRVRDLFIIGAFTGLRVSDYNNIKEENIKEVNGKRMLSLKTKKTGTKVVVPFHPFVADIFDRYGNKPPQRMDEQTINKLIKEVAESCGIDGIEYIKTTRGGEEVTEKKYRFEMTKTHTARRSFCTNAYKSGIGMVDLMKISGHTSEKNFLNYIKISEEEHAERMASHRFFGGV